MTVLSRPRHPIVADALALAGQWYAGYVVDGAPALSHAVKVALVLGRHVPDPAPGLVAAGLLHGCPEYAPKDVDLDTLLVSRFGPAVVRVVRGLQRERTAPDERLVPAGDRWVLCTSAADKIVSLGSMLRGAGSLAGYWPAIGGVVERLSYFGAFHTAAAPYLPPGMAGELARLVVRAEHATTRLSTVLPGGAA